MLVIRPGDRLGITGQNGSGKSTLIEKMVTLLNLGNEHVTYIPQEIDAARSEKILSEAGQAFAEADEESATIITDAKQKVDEILNEAEQAAVKVNAESAAIFTDEWQKAEQAAAELSDKAKTEAKVESAAIIADARQKAAQILRKAKRTAKKLTNKAKAEADRK